MNSKKKIMDGAFLIMLFSVTMIFAIYVPFLLFILILFMPIPFVVFTYRYNIKELLIMVVATALVSLLLTLVIGNLLIPALFVLSVIGGVAIGIAIHQKKSPYDTLVQGIIGFIIGLMFVFLYTQLVLDINWQNEIELVLTESFEASHELVKEFSPSEQIIEQFEVIEDQIEVLLNLMPVGIALMGIGMAFSTQWLSYRLLSSVENKRFRFPPVRKLQFPIVIVWIYIIALLITLFLSDTASGIYTGAQNVLVLAGFLIIVQGFTFLFFYAHHKEKSNILPILAIILSVLLPFLIYLIRILGIIDMGFALRKQIKGKKKD